VNDSRAQRKGAAIVTDFFSDETRRNPYPLYERMRKQAPVYHVPPPFDAWMVFDYRSVKWLLSDHVRFSSRVPAPRDWFIFFDPPDHTKLRALVSKAFAPGVIAKLEPRIREISHQLLDRATERGEMDLAADYSIPLPMKVIAGIIGIPDADWLQFKRWNDIILKLSYARSGGEAAATAVSDFRATTDEMSLWLEETIRQRRDAPRDDLMTQLIAAEVDGARLAATEILGFLQLLIVAGQETTTNLINNAVLCLIENPDQKERLKKQLDLLPLAIEEVLRYRSPLQWIMRTTRADTDLCGTTIPAGKLVLPMIGSANRDPEQFREADRFDIIRDPNPHIAFGHGIHFCLGAQLSRMEARIGLSDILGQMKGMELAGDGRWKPREALHVLGPASLPIRFERIERDTRRQSRFGAGLKPTQNAGTTATPSE
jgi:cytochrome P450